MARNRLMWDGLADQLIPFQSNIYYHSKVLDYYGGEDNVSPWLRFFLPPWRRALRGRSGPTAAKSVQYDGRLGPERCCARFDPLCRRGPQSSAVPISPDSDL